MKTTEIFVEQVLIGLMVLFAAGALVHPPLVETILKMDDLTALAAVVAAAYLVGIVWDRIADTILEGLERHNRLSIALDECESGVPYIGDPFPENRYRMRLFSSEAALDYAHYLRIRMRLTRSLATLAPALSIATANLLLPGPSPVEPAGEWAWAAVPWLVALGYGAALIGRFLRPTELGDLRGGVRRWIRMPKLPRTIDLSWPADRELYIQYIGYTQGRPAGGWLAVLLRRETLPWILVVLSLSSAAVLGWRAVISEPSSPSVEIERTATAPGVHTIPITGQVAETGRSPDSVEPDLFARLRIAVGLPLAGLVLALLFTWAWWRIQRTYFVFLRDFDLYGPDEGAG